jgi:bidirectional [NiFe] hydrogenase diaphorase subunit
MKILINGKEVTAEPEQTIVEVARRNDVFIPTLCHVPALEPAAMCRVCTVEITERGRTRLVTACNYPLRGDAEIQTESELVRQGRKLIIELLYARCPDSSALRALAERYGARLDRFAPETKECIMCGLCARVCEQVGGNVLALCGRGVEIQVDTSFGRPADTCIGCGACAQICPVEKIKIEDVDGERRVIVRGKEAARVPLRRCSACGARFGPVIDLKKVLERAGESGVPDFNRNVCPVCSRRSLAHRLGERYFEQYELEPPDPGEES